MAPLSFEPVAEAAHSVFSRYPATLLGESDPMTCRPGRVFAWIRPDVAVYVSNLDVSEEKPAASESAERMEPRFSKLER